MVFDKSNENCYIHYMNYFVNITSQGQISIPVKLRRKYKMDKAGQVIVRDIDNAIVLTPSGDIDALMGSLHTKKRFTRTQERVAFEEAIGKGEA